MAKILIAGDVIVVTSSKKLEDIKTLEKYEPKALSLYETDPISGTTSEVFKVGSTSGAGCINKYGASFASASRDGQGFATITLPIPAGTEDVVAYASDVIGFPLMKLNDVEAGIDAALEKVAEKKAAILSNIDVM